MTIIFDLDGTLLNTMQVAQFASMTLMQAASPAPAQTGIPIGSGDTDQQW